MKNALFKKGLNGNILKIIALVTMTVDHIGVMVFPNVYALRIIGRVAMPIFAFMIAEGCYYSKHKLRYFALVFGVGVLCFFGYLIFLRQFYLNILITFSFSIVIIFSVQYACASDKKYAFLLPVFTVLLSAFVNYGMPYITGIKNAQCDYGFFGTLLPVGIYFFNDFRLKLLYLAAGLTLIALSFGGVQWFAFLSVIFIAFYDGTRGKFNFKYFFYLYYPLHFIVIYAFQMIL